MRLSPKATELLDGNAKIHLMVPDTGYASEIGLQEMWDSTQPFFIEKFLDVRGNAV
jgi:hypothetical protein